MLNRNVETFLGCDCNYADAKIVLFGAPFDSTCSNRPGTRFASTAIRAESEGLETYSPYQDKDLLDCFVFDSGDLDLSPGNTKLSLENIHQRAQVILADGKLPFLIGGEHLVTFGAVRAVLEKYPDLHILHFDAHADLRDKYLGTGLSHACVIRRCWELVGDTRIYQFGIRSGDREEFLWADAGHVTMRKFDFNGLDHAVKALSGLPVYLTIDLDVLDPSAFPGTGTPEAGGVSFLQLLEAIKTVCRGGNIVGCDITELSPPLDPSGVSTAAACKVVREILLALS